MTNYVINEDFHAGVLPAHGVNSAANGWDFAAGSTSRSNLGLGRGFEFDAPLYLTEQTLRVAVKLTRATDQFAIYKRPIGFLAGTTYGSVVALNVANNRLDIYAGWDGISATLPASAIPNPNGVLTALKLAINRVYWLDFIQCGKVSTVQVTDVATGANQSFSVNNEPKHVTGYGFGRPGFCNLNGNAQVSLLQHSANVQAPSTGIWGDSITHAYGATWRTGYSYQALALLPTPGNGWISACDGTTAAECLVRLQAELAATGSPPNVFVLIGTNNAATDALRDAYLATMQAIDDCITGFGKTPSYGALPPNADPVKQSRINTMNQQLRTMCATRGRSLAQFDTLLSVNGDGVTQNTALFFDATHPNATGYNMMVGQLQSDCPQLFT